MGSQSHVTEFIMIQFGLELNCPLISSTYPKVALFVNIKRKRVTSFVDLKLSEQAINEAKI